MTTSMSINRFAFIIVHKMKLILNQQFYQVILECRRFLHQTVIFFYLSVKIILRDTCIQIFNTLQWKNVMLTKRALISRSKEQN